MARYEFRQDGVQHGWLSVFDAEGNLLATEECHHTVEAFHLQAMTSHVCIPRQMIPLGDPRWYTHCQWCGVSVVGQKAYYLRGQYHANCYEHLFMQCLDCGKKTMEVYDRMHPYQFPPDSRISTSPSGPQLCDTCYRGEHV